MNEMFQDFISEEHRKFHFRMGRHLASALSGFMVGVVIASIVWGVGVWYFKRVQQITTSNPAAPHLTIVPPPRAKTE